MIGTAFSVLFQAACLVMFALGVWGLAWAVGLAG
jgi:hypothetical protein